MTTWKCVRSDELQHHGIKGQKWGIRRFQNKDGSLTPAGRRRYDDSPGERKNSRNETISIDGQTFKVYGNRKSNKAYVDKIEKKAKNLGVDVVRNPEKTKKEKQQKQYKIPENKSLHRLKLEEKYRQQGFSPEEAEQKAAKRIRGEKFVAGAAAITVASCIAYAKYKGYTSDKTIKANSDFQRIMRLTENAEIRKDYRQYVTYDKKDKILYKGMFADHLDGLRSGNENIYDVTVRNRKEIKIASEKRARDTFVDLYKNDKEFRNEFRERLQRDSFGYSFYKLESMFRKVHDGDDLTDRELKGKVYDIFNVMLTGADERTERNANRFYDALRKQGVNAVLDINDSKVNNYHAKRPLILFDGEFDNVKKRIMDNAEIQENINKHVNRSSKQSSMILGASMVGMYASIPVYNKAQMDRKILEYKQAHPNTTMTDSEIEEMFKKES